MSNSKATRDCYEILGLGRSASQEEIKKTYRKLAIQFHPDKNPGNKEAEEKFKEATEAYTILSNPDSRARYDQFGYAAFQQGAGGFQGDFTGFEDIFGDIFGAFFGGTMGGSGGGRTRGRAGRDLKYDLEITFEEAAFGAEKNISVSRRNACETCNGSGAAEGSKQESCPGCRGAGQIRMQQGFFSISRTCPQCNGEGKIIKNPCKSCSGSGLKAVQSKINVKIPAGIDHGQRLKLRGEGEAGSLGGPAGDLYVQIAVQEHAIFERQDADLICEIPISYGEAVLGAEIETPTLEGKSIIKIPPGTQSGKLFRLRGKGIQVLGENTRGDQIVRVVIDVPRKVSEEEREVLEKLIKVSNKRGASERTARKAGSESKGFMDRVKDMFG